MHPGKRKFAVVLLAAGTLLGFGHGFATLRGRACARRDAFEKHVAEVCVDAARRDRADGDDGDGDRGRDHEGPRRGPRAESDSLH